MPIDAVKVIDIVETMSWESMGMFQVGHVCRCVAHEQAKLKWHDRHWEPLV